MHRFLFLQDPIVGDDATLKSLGICSGDTVWVRGPFSSTSALVHGAPPASTSPPAEQAASPTTRPAAQSLAGPTQPGDHMEIDQQLPASATCKPAAKEAVTSGSTLSSSTPVASHPPASGAIHPSIHAEQIPAAQQQQGKEKQEHGDPGHYEPSPEEQEQLEQEIATLPSRPSVPYLLLRLCSSYQNQALKPTEHLVLAVHAAMLESGFVPVVTQGLSPSVPTALPVAAAAGAASAASPAGALASWQLPKAAAGTYTLQYSYSSSSSTNRTSSISSSSSNAAPAAAAVGGVPACTCVVKVLDLGAHAVIVGALNTAATATSQLKAGASSSSAAAAARSSSSSASLQVVQTVTVPLKQYITPAAVPAAPAAAGLAAAGTAAAAAGCGGVLLLSAYRNLSDLWVLVKDKVSLPLLISCCRHLGDSPPFGVTAMPWEMQEAVLRKLKVGMGGGTSRMGRDGVGWEGKSS